MNTRLQRILRKILTIGMAFVMVAVLSIFPSQHTPVVQAQGGEATFVFSDLQFDGSRYYYPATLFASYISVDYRIYLTDNIDYIVNEIGFVSTNVDTSVFFPDPPPCIGFGNCATRCNLCVADKHHTCKLIAIGKALIAGGTFILSLACAIGAAATIVGLGVAFLCGIGAGAVLAGAALVFYGEYLTCKSNAYSACTNENPPCVCTPG